MADVATQVAQAPKGAEYGEAEADLQRQQQQPVAGGATPTASPGTAAAAGQAMPGMGPGEIPTLSDPSAFPDEPLTAGLPSGAGPGTEVLQSAAFGPPELSVMRGIYQKYPNDDIRRLIEWTENNLA